MIQEQIRNISELSRSTALISLTVLLVNLISYWRIYTKARQPGWAIFIPVFNIICWLRICRRPAWWFLLLFIPFVNIVVSFVLVFDIARFFKRGTMFAFGMIFLPFLFYPLLGLGRAQYHD